MMMAQMAGDEEIVALFKARCPQEEPGEEVLLAWYICLVVLYIRWS